MPPANPSNSEWLTRKILIDGKLKAVGWRVLPFASGKSLAALDRCAIEEFPTASGPADYALCLGGQIVGIVEAKKLTLGPQNVLSQAERYSKGFTQPALQAGEFGIPFLYSTNGEVIWHHDVRNSQNSSRQIAEFHTPEGIGEILSFDFDAAIARLRSILNKNSKLRPYQFEANEAIEHAIADRKRAMLAAMATRTGKTYTMVNEIYRLMKSGTARRVLFLVDRRALAAQAVRAFGSFDADQGSLSPNNICYFTEFHPLRSKERLSAGWMSGLDWQTKLRPITGTLNEEWINFPSLSLQEPSAANSFPQKPN